MSTPITSFGVNIGRSTPAADVQFLRPHSSCDAKRAPSARLSNLAHITCGCTREMVSTCAKPQSVDAMTFSRPSSFANLTMRSAINRGCSTVVVWWVMTPGMRIFPAGNFTFLPDPPLVLVSNVGGFDQVGTCIDLQDQVDDCLERRVRDVRNVPAAEAHMVADAIGWNALERMIQRFDSQLCPAAVIGRALLRELVVHVGEHGVVDLKHETSFVLRDTPLVMQSAIANYVFAFGAVILVERVVSHASGRHCRDKSFFRPATACQGSLEIRSVPSNAGAILIEDGTNAGISRRPLHSAWKSLRHELSEPFAIAAEPRRRGELSRTRFEAAQARKHVVGPARLPEFTVVDDVESGLRLFADHVGHQSCEALSRMPLSSGVVLSLRPTVPITRGA